MTGLGRQIKPVYQVVVLSALACGCDRVTYVPPAEPSPLSDTFPAIPLDGPPGLVTGRVTWAGDVPVAPPFQGVRWTAGVPSGFLAPNPFAPRVDLVSRGLDGAVVFLRGIDKSRAKPWDIPPVTVEVAGDALLVNAKAVGFVPVGGNVLFVSHEPVMHVIRGRGTAFFSITLPEPDRPRTRKFEQPGRVELTSGSGRYWVGADLFVCEHPYYALTSEQGQFSLDGVPPGRYELVVWHRNWQTSRTERDPDSGLVVRMAFAEPAEVVQPIGIEPGQTSNVDVSLDLTKFPSPSHPATK